MRPRALSRPWEPRPARGAFRRCRAPAQHRRRDWERAAPSAELIRVLRAAGNRVKGDSKPRHRVKGRQGPPGHRGGGRGPAPPWAAGRPRTWRAGSGEKSFCEQNTSHSTQKPAQRGGGHFPCFHTAPAANAQEKGRKPKTAAQLQLHPPPPPEDPAWRTEPLLPGAWAQRLGSLCLEGSGQGFRRPPSHCPVEGSVYSSVTHQGRHLLLQAAAPVSCFRAAQDCRPDLQQHHLWPLRATPRGVSLWSPFTLCDTQTRLAQARGGRVCCCKAASVPIPPPFPRSGAALRLSLGTLSLP